MKRIRYFLCGLWAFGAVCFAGGCGTKSLPEASADAAGENLVRVKVVSPQRTTLKRITTQPATVYAWHQAELYARVAGYLKELKVDIGSRVEEGAVLGVIDVPELMKSREKQQAIITRLQAEEKRSVAAIRLATATVTAAEAARDRAKADIAKAAAQLAADQAEFRRVQQLVSTRTVASRLLDEARKRLDSARAAKTSAQAAYESAKANVTVAAAKLAVAQADQEASQAETNVARKQLEELNVRIKYATLTAPFAGIITARNVDPGDLVRNIQAASDTARRPLFSVAQLDKVRVRITVPENDAPWADKGDAVTFRFRSLPGHSFKTQISRIASRLDESTRTMLVEADLANPEHVLLPGMYAEATILLKKKADALVLPAGAVRYDETGRSYVYVVDAGDIIRVVDVHTGFDDGKRIEIISGLNEQSSVVAAMVGRLQAGQQVHVEGR